MKEDSQRLPPLPPRPDAANSSGDAAGGAPRPSAPGVSRDPSSPALRAAKPPTVPTVTGVTGSGPRPMRPMAPTPTAMFSDSIKTEVTSPPPLVEESLDAEDVNLSESTVPPPPAKVDPYVGKTIDSRYFVDSVLGEGGMGIVYRGKHKVIDKKVAIKVLRGEMAKDAEITERFLQEARAASAIGNAHIVDISDFGQLPDGSTYFVMEYLDGKGLGDVMKENRPLPVTRLVRIARQIAEGLGAAHSANIIHRDLKPDNVMLVARGAEKDFVKVLDFGIAKVGGATSAKTRAGSVFGTPHYMSPEQAAGATVDARTDIYALGVILYEMASGKVPFDADNFMGILTQHMYKAPVPMRALVPEINVPPGLDAVVLKCLTKKPEGRYSSMAELVEDLDKLDQGLLPDAVQELMARSGGFNVPADYFRNAMPEPVPATPVAKRSRMPLYAAIAAVGTILGAAGVVLVAKSKPTTAQTPSAQTAMANGSSYAASLPSGTASAAAPLQAKQLVLISIVPPDAVVKRDGVDLGASPIDLHLAEDEAVKLVISKDGYKTETVDVTAAEKRRTVTLKREAGPSPAAQPSTKGTQAPPVPAVPVKPPAGDPDDPWLKRNR